MLVYRRVTILDSSRCRISFDPWKCIWRQIVACAWSWKHISTEVSKSACRQHDDHMMPHALWFSVSSMVFFSFPVSSTNENHLSTPQQDSCRGQVVRDPSKALKKLTPIEHLMTGGAAGHLGGQYQRHLPEMAWCICGRCFAHFFMMCLWLFMHVFISNYLSIFMYQETCLFVYN